MSSSKEGTQVYHTLNLGKFDSKADKDIFLGYSFTSKAYIVYNK